MAMQLVLVSGMSGSGKSIVLTVLEDAGYYCVDNLPASLLAEVVGFLSEAGHAHVAVSVDVLALAVNGDDGPFRPGESEVGLARDADRVLEVQGVAAHATGEGLHRTSLSGSAGSAGLHSPVAAGQTPLSSAILLIFQSPSSLTSE